MFGFLIVVISLIAILLCVIILIQSAKGGGLAASFGGASSSTDSFMGGRQTANALTRMSWIGGGVFLFLSLVLAVLSARPAQAPESILRTGAGQSTLPEAPPSLLETQPAAGAGATDTAAGAAGDTSGGADGATPGEGAEEGGSGPDGP